VPAGWMCDTQWRRFEPEHRWHERKLDRIHADMSQMMQEMIQVVLE
jgi:hypothetical protein